MRPFRSIAIDGPSGAGKSTLAKALAARLGFLYVDTGAIYRTVGLYVARQGGDCGDPQQVLPRLPELQLSLTYGADGLQHMLLAGEDSIREIIPFPMNKNAQDVMMGAPSTVEQKQLDELHIAITALEEE